MMDSTQENKNSVAFLGPRASYTHRAAIENFPHEKYVLEPMENIGDIFVAVQNAYACYGVVPFENSTNGSVVITLDLFADREQECPDVYVWGEAYVDVHHCLVGYFSKHPRSRPPSGDLTPKANIPAPSKPRVQPLADISHVRRILSHPQAFGQCEAFLSAYMKGVERQEVSSTSRAAEMVTEDDTGTVASISSDIAAGHYGLDVLANGIEDRNDNTTRFLIIRRGPDFHNSLTRLQDQKLLKWKTLVAFTIDHHSPGALADALMVFKTFDLNLTSINSRPSRYTPWHYIFFVEFEGRKETNGQGKVNEALSKLKHISQGYRWHGSWVNQATT